jgi:DNA polymerase III epsilon subunit-like protein
MSVTTIHASQVVRDPSGKISAAISTIVSTRAEQVEPRWDKLTKVIGIDGEFQRIKWFDGDTWHHAPGRISLVSSEKVLIYDVFVHFNDEDVYDVALEAKHRKLGVYWPDIEPANGARPIAEVEEFVRLIVKDRIVVGHAIENDTRVFSKFVFKGVETRDTQLLEEYRVHGRGADRKPALSTLAKVILQRDIQGGEHSSVEDARATMDLYLHRKDEFEKIAEAQKKASAIKAEQATSTLAASVIESVSTAADRLSLSTPPGLPGSATSSAALWQAGARKIKESLKTPSATTFISKSKHQACASSSSTASTLTSSGTTPDLDGTPASSISPHSNGVSPPAVLNPHCEVPTPSTLIQALEDVQSASHASQKILSREAKDEQDNDNEITHSGQQSPPEARSISAIKTAAAKVLKSKDGEECKNPSGETKLSWAKVVSAKKELTAAPFASTKLAVKQNDLHAPAKPTWASIVKRA